MSKITAKLLKKQQIAENTWMLTFEKKYTMHKAGQYTTIFLGRDNRDFTIASSPLNKTSFSLITKKGITEFKKKLFTLPIGGKIQMLPPAGGFVLPENSTIPHVLLAGGIGMNPFYSMVQYVYEKKLAIPLTLIVSFSKKEDIIFYSELQKIQKENPQIKIIHTLSQDTWESETGRISQELIKKYISDVQDAAYMIAGSEKMVEDTQDVLLQMGIDQSKIRIDIFTGY